MRKRLDSSGPLARTIKPKNGSSVSLKTLEKVARTGKRGEIMEATTRLEIALSRDNTVRVLMAQLAATAGRQ
jgi:hypothetical protein